MLEFTIERASYKCPITEPSLRTKCVTGSQSCDQLFGSTFTESELGDDTDTFSIVINSDDKVLVGSYELQVQAFDEASDLESTILNIFVDIVDPCDQEVLQLTTSITESSVDFPLKQEPLLYQISILRSVQNCPVDLSLNLVCNGGECPQSTFIDLYSVTPGSDDYELCIQTDSEADMGEWVLEIYAYDRLNEIQSETKTLTVSVIDLCENQLIRIAELPQSYYRYELGQEDSLQIELEALKFIPECPADIELLITCGDELECPDDYFYSLSDSSDEGKTAWIMEVETVNEKFVGLHEITFSI